jgi:eukaryotic-like serine/threonine-protein kinase
MNRTAHRWDYLRSTGAPLAVVAWLAAAAPLCAQGLGTKSGAGGRPTETSGGIDWMAIVLLTGLVGLLGTVAYLVLKGQGKGQVGGRVKKRSGGVTATDTQIDNYRLVTMMMTGQTSQVWEVAEISSGRHFAIKMLLPEHVRSAEQRRFLFHEAEVAQQIVHPNIIKVLAIVKDPQNPYVVMEFFPSTNLKLRVMHKDPFVKENFKTIVDQSATALAFMHEKGWVHRDVKPDNILVNASAEVRLIDFALAKRSARGKGGLFGRKKGKIQGTRSYMSPEQIRGEPVDGRADLYSFGATMYELITGRPPFVAGSATDLLNKQLLEKPTPPQVYNKDVSDDLANLVVRILAKKREERPKDFYEFLAKFRGIRVLFKPRGRP